MYFDQHLINFLASSISQSKGVLTKVSPLLLFLHLRFMIHYLRASSQVANKTSREACVPLSISHLFALAGVSVLPILYSLLSLSLWSGYMRQ